MHLILLAATLVVPAGMVPFVAAVWAARRGERWRALVVALVAAACATLLWWGRPEVAVGPVAPGYRFLVEAQRWAFVAPLSIGAAAMAHARAGMIVAGAWLALASLLLLVPFLVPDPCAEV